MLPAPSPSGRLRFRTRHSSIEVPPECGELGRERTGEGRTPALFEDGPLDTFHAAVGLGAASRDADVLRTKVMGGRPELLATELRAVVGGDPAERPPSGFEVPGDALEERTRERASGFWGVWWSSARVEALVTLMAVYCQTRPFVPRYLPLLIAPFPPFGLARRPSLRRLYAVHVAGHLPEAQLTREAAERLSREGAGILALLVRECGAYLREGLVPGASAPA